MTIADGSISHHLRPCAAERGKAWWLWCQLSPKDGIASQKTLVDWSSTSKRRLPKKWQTELTDQVTWCWRKMRTKPPQMRPVTAPLRLQLSRPPSDGGDQQAGEHDQRELAVEDAHAAVLDEVLGVLVRAGLTVRLPEPAGVRVPEAAQRAHDAVAVTDVRGVRIALDVGVRVVLAVVGDPVDDRPLDREHAHVGERVARRLVRLEGAMGQHAVEADGDAETTDQVHEDEDGDVGPAKPDTPEQRDRGGGDGERAGRLQPCSHGALAESCHGGYLQRRSASRRLGTDSCLICCSFVLVIPRRGARTAC